MASVLSVERILMLWLNKIIILPRASVKSVIIATFYHNIKIMDVVSEYVSSLRVHMKVTIQKPNNR